MISGQNPYLLYIIAAGFAILLGLIAFIGYFSVKKNNSKSVYDEQLNELLLDETKESNTKVTLGERWNRYWGERFKAMGWSRYDDSNSTAGRDIILFGFVLCGILGVVFKSFLLGLVITIIGIYVVAVVMKTKANKDADVIAAQLPGFLFALKANIQANETPERAILKVVDNMPSPLHEDLFVAKKKILANASFKESLQDLSKKTSSKDLQFLCACMIQASASGANLENQITVIQKVLEARRKISDELAKATRSSSAAIWVATLVLPTTFVATLFLDANSAEFWFHGIISWVAFALIVILYFVGVLMCKKLVDNIKNL